MQVEIWCKLQSATDPQMCLPQHIVLFNNAGGSALKGLSNKPGS